MKRNYLFLILAATLFSTCAMHSFAQSPLVLTYPNAGSFSQGQQVPISWQGGDTSKPIYLALISQTPFRDVETIVVSMSYGNGTYNGWIIPADIVPGRYGVYVQSNRGAAPSQWNYGGLITINATCVTNGQPRLVITRDSSLMPSNRTIAAGSQNVDYVRFNVTNTSACDIVIGAFAESGGSTAGTSNGMLFLNNILSRIYDQNGNVYSSRYIGQTASGLSSFTIHSGVTLSFDWKLSFPSSLPGPLSVSGSGFQGSLGGVAAFDAATGNQLVPSDIQIVGLCLTGGIITLQ